MANNVIMRSLKIRDLFDQTGGYINYDLKVCYPVYEEGREVIEKIKGDFIASVRKSRNLNHHRKIFALYNKAIENMELIDIFPDVKPLVIRTLELRMKKKVDVINYIMKWLYLPLVPDLKPDGKTDYKVNSISFEKMDQIEFTEFYDKVVDHLSLAMGIERHILEKEIN